jgi:predicted PurR-regulated permease PerM
MSAPVSLRYWTADRIMRLIIGLVITGLLVWLIRYLSNVLLPFFVACLIAYLLQPIVEFNRRLVGCKGRVIPSILTIIDVTVVLGLVVYMFLPSVIHELDSLGDIIRSVTSGQRAMPRFHKSVVDFIAKYFDPDNLASFLDGSHLQTLMSQGSSIIEESLSVVMDMISWFLTLIYILFILIDYPAISNGFKLIIPRKWRPGVLKVIYEVQDYMDRYFRGQGVVALCAAVFYCIGFSIVKLPLAIPMGILVGVLYMIPYFQYVTLIPVAVICFICSLTGEVTFASMFGRCIMVYVVSQCICDYIITPHIMGKEMGMNPAVILLSLSVWGSLLGIIGMIIALPVTAILMTYYQRYISDPADPSAEGDSPADSHPGT